MTDHPSQPKHQALRASARADDTGVLRVRAARRLLAPLLPFALLLALGSSPAAAAEEHALLASFGSPGTAAGQFGFTPESGAAVDQATGDVYVADTVNHRVEKFGPLGEFIDAWGWGVHTGAPEAQVCSSGCQAGLSGPNPGQFEEPTFIAVDNTPGGNGDVYVANRGALVNERQTVTLSGATSGHFTLNFTSTLHATVTAGSNLVTDVVGTWRVGDPVSGPGIPPGATIAQRISGTELELSAAATGGGVSVVLGATDTTAPIAYNAPANQGEGAGSVEAALENLLEGKVSVSGGAGGPYTVEFIQNLADTNVEQMTCEGAGLSPVGASCTVATAVDGFNGNRVEKFDSSGSLITAWGGSPAGGELDGTTCANGNNCGDNPHFDSLEGVAVLNALPGVPVKPEGSLLVLASQFTEWSQSSGDFITIIGDEGHESPIGIAVDPAGHVYVGTGGGGSRKEVIQTSYCNKEELSGPCPESNAHEGYVYHENCVVDPGPATGVAVDPSSEDVYVARYDPVSSQGSVAAYGSACNPLESPFGGNPGEIVRPAGVAASGFSGSKGYVYVVDEGSNRVEVFAPGGLRHKLTVSRAGSGLGSVGSEPAGTIACPSLCSASLSQGTVVTLTATPPAHASFVGWAGGGCSGAGTCQLTLTADTAVSAIFAYDRPVLTPPALAAITANTATLDGTVNPEGDAFSCRFEYGTTTAYGAEAPCLTRPGAGAGPVSVSAELWDLAAGTTYHYRLVSVNSGGASYGPDQTFTTASETCATDAALCLARPVEVSLTSQASGLPSLVLPKQPGGTTTARGLTNAQKLAKALKACGTHRKKGTRVGCEKQARKKYGPAKHKAKKSTRSRKRG